jgi:hypothetical protein
LATNVQVLKKLKALLEFHTDLFGSRWLCSGICQSNLAKQGSA